MKEPFLLSSPWNPVYFRMGFHVPLSPFYPAPYLPLHLPLIFVNSNIFCFLTSSVLVADVREAPDISQVHSVADHRQQEVHLLAPGFSGPLQAGLLDHQSPEACQRRRGPRATSGPRGRSPSASFGPCSLPGTLRAGCSEAIGHLLAGAWVQGFGSSLRKTIHQHQSTVFLLCTFLFSSDIFAPFVPLLLILALVHCQHAGHHHIFRLHWFALMLLLARRLGVERGSQWRWRDCGTAAWYGAH